MEDVREVGGLSQYAADNLVVLLGLRDEEAVTRDQLAYVRLRITVMEVRVGLTMTGQSVRCLLCMLL